MYTVIFEPAPRMPLGGADVPADSGADAQARYTAAHPDHRVVMVLDQAGQLAWSVGKTAKPRHP